MSDYNNTTPVLDSDEQEKPSRKERKKQKKEQRAKQLALEKQLVEEGKIPKRNRYKARGFFWRVFGLCLAFVFGIITAIGGTVGTIVYFGTKRSTKDLLKLFGITNTLSFLTEEYANMPALDLVTSVLDDLNSMPQFTIGFFSKYTPLIDDYLGKINESLADLGLTITDDDWSELKNTEFSKLGTYFTDTFLPKVELKPILEKVANNDDQMVKALIDALSETQAKDAEGNLLYENGEPVMRNTTIKDLLKDAQGIMKGALSGIKLSDVLGETDDPVMKALMTTTENGVERPTTLKDLMDNAQGIIMGVKFSDVIGETDDPIIKALMTTTDENGEERPTTLKDLTENAQGIIMDVELRTVLGDSTDPIVKALLTMKDENGERPTTFNDLTENASTIVRNLDVETIFGIDAKSEPALRFFAYGPELSKDDNGNYIYDTELVPDGDGALQYKDGGRYIIQEIDGVDTVVMLQDPNAAEGVLYSKKTIEDLDNSELLGGAKMSSLITIKPNSSSLINAIKDWTIDDLQNENKIMNELTVGKLLGIDSSSSKIMQALQNKTFNELKDQSVIESLKIGDIIDLGNNPSGILQAIAEWEIGDLNSQDKIESLKLSDIIDLGENPSGILKVIAGWSLGNLTEQSRFEHLKIGQLITIGSDAPKLLQTIKYWRISDLTSDNAFNSLTLRDVISLDSDSALLKTLADMPLTEIGSSLDSLTLEDVLGAKTFEDNANNLILAALRYKSVDELGASVANLTVEDVFGNEIWSYAKNYVENTRVTEKVEASNVETRYFYNGVEVFANWYKADGTKITGDETLRKNKYSEKKIYVTRTPSYLIVDYTKDSAEWQTLNTQGIEILHDEFDCYYMDGDARVDLEEVYTYYNGSAQVTGRRILTETVAGETKYYYVEKSDVTLLYAAEGSTETHTQNEVTVKYMVKGSDDEVTRYMSGVWYLLLAEKKAEGTVYNSDKPITELGSTVTGMASKINSMTLGEMYVRELIEQDPSQDISGLITMFHIQSLEGYTNLNQLSVNQVIQLVISVANGGQG